MREIRAIQNEIENGAGKTSDSEGQGHPHIEYSQSVQNNVSKHIFRNCD